MTFTYPRMSQVGKLGKPFTKSMTSVGQWRTILLQTLSTRASDTKIRSCHHLLHRASVRHGLATLGSRRFGLQAAYCRAGMSSLGPFAFQDSGPHVESMFRCIGRVGGVVRPQVRPLSLESRRLRLELYIVRSTQKEGLNTEACCVP